MTSSRRVRFVTGSDDPEGDSETRFLTTQLRGGGWEVDIAVWSDPTVDWRAFPLTVLRSTWDYPRHLEAFLAWTERAAGLTELLNRPELVRANVDKRYLLDLGARGIDIVPSVWVEHPNEDRVAETRRRFACDDLVAKPAVGCDGIGVVRIAPGDPAPAVDVPTHGGWLLQPFASSIHSRGERSVVLIDGRPVHATLKRPASGEGGEFRVQERWGGDCLPAEPAPGEWARAREVIEAVGEGPAPLYARVDFLCWNDDWCVAEVELIEPSLYLLADPARVAPFERALRRRLDAP